MSKPSAPQLPKALPYFSFGFTGRIGRLEFANRFMTYSFLIVAIYLLYYFVIKLGIFALFDSHDRSTDMTKTLIKLIFHAGLLGAMLLLNIRMVIMRLHDINLSGWWSCIIFSLPYLTTLIIVMIPMTLHKTLIYLLFYLFAAIGLAAQLFPFIMPGNQQSNNYGSPTKAGHPIGLFLLILGVIIGGYFLYQSITLQSLSVAFLETLQ